MNGPLIRLGRTASFVLLFFLPAPIVVIAATSFAAAGYLRFPPGELSLRWYLEAATDPRWGSAFMTSLGIAAVGHPVLDVAEVGVRGLELHDPAGHLPSV